MKFEAETEFFEFFPIEFIENVIEAANTSIGNTSEHLQERLTKEYPQLSKQQITEVRRH